MGQEHAAEEIDLARLAAQAKLGFNQDRGVAALELRRVTGSVGGAQPKALVTLEPRTGRFWVGAVECEGGVPLILKFQDDADDDTPLLEHALSLTAKRCGIDAVDSMLVSGKDRQGRILNHFAAKRFDIRDSQRVHYLSFAGATEGKYGIGEAASADYVHVLTATVRLSRDVRAGEEMLRRAIFNVAVANIDDHIRNHGFLFDGKEWHPAPAFDLIHAAITETTERAMPVAGRVSNIMRADIERLIAQAGLPRQAADRALEQVGAGLKEFFAVAAAATLLLENAIAEIAVGIEQRYRNMTDDTLT
ncbi:MAG: HipA domain-containing protein [Verrucomicrobiales bacterium]|nr:HipA domain-containing protein [Verrucomicrobiales bacterium]